jgi:DNA topoisomerase I
VQLMERRGIGRPSTYAPTIKILKERAYVQGTKGKLQPTALGLQLDASLEQLIPDLIQPEFTAQMEAALDTIEQGQQEWQRYLIDWHHGYFAPALSRAMQQLRDRAIVLSPTTIAASPPATSAESAPERSITEPACPRCGAGMTKVASRSQKLKADHFLKCTAPGCPTVLFWNPQQQHYELPYAQRSTDPSALTEIPCPVCGAWLERHDYCKDGVDKVMLRCSIPEHRQGKCNKVAFFQVKDGFWSPSYGTLSRSLDVSRNQD